MTATVTLLMVVLLFSSQSQASEKTRMLQALRDLKIELQRVPAAPTSSIVSLDWFEGEATLWTPKTAEEGRGLRESFERMTVSVRSARANGNIGKLLPLVDEDLQDKREYCSSEGLSRRREVRIVTKRNAIAEVKGLEVFYLEKFLESDASAKAQQFRGFSSPAVDDLVPGRYLFWAKEPGPAGKSGARKEARVSAGTPADPIEVLAP